MNLNRGYRKSNIPDNAKRVFEGVIFDTYQWDQKLYDGSTAVFEMLARPDTVVVFPVLTDGTILLIDDIQPARKDLLTAPAGRVEEGETPAVTAARELMEETGYQAARLDLLYAYAPLHKTDWIVHVFIGKQCQKVGEPHLDAGEKITPHPVSFDELVELAVLGKYSSDNFSEFILRTKLNPEKMAELKTKFLG
jgi:ADP-ribose pyrophosphatase